VVQEWYVRGMKIKTSVTLSEELLEKMDRQFGARKNRSELIERAVWDFIAREQQKRRDLTDLEILNNKAGELNEEAADVLAYQVEL
jgi:metal-responsive CopG/Arc/MetJ family transcriptional regulator